MYIPFIQLEPTNICNLSCLTCSRTEFDCFGHMKLDEFRTVLDKLPQLQAIKMQGMGEPLLNPDFPDMLCEAKKRNVRTYTATNATVFKRIDIDKFVEYIDRVEISIDSPDPEVFEELRNGAVFEQVVENVRLLTEKSKDTGKQISVNYVYQKDNISEVNKMLDLCECMGIEIMNMNPVQDWIVGETEMKKKISRHRSEVNKDLWIDKANSKGIELRFQKNFDNWNDCYWYERTFYLTWNGFITPCCLRPNPKDINFGNIFEEDLKNLWNSDKWSSFRNNLASNKPNRECIGCSFKK